MPLCIISEQYQSMDAASMAEFIQFLQNEVLASEHWSVFCPYLEKQMEAKAKFYFQNVANSMDEKYKINPFLHKVDIFQINELNSHVQFPNSWKFCPFVHDI